MDPDTITLHISSNDGVVSNTANNTKISIYGFLPEKTKTYMCEVVNYIINIDSLNSPPGFFSLVVENFIKNGVSSNKKAYDIICDCSTINGEMKNKGSMFTVENFNNKDLTFQMIDPYGVIIADSVINDTVNTVWNLTIRLKPII